MYTDRSRSSSNEGGWSRPFWYRFLQTGMESSFVPVGAGEVGWGSGDPCGRPSSFHREGRGRPQRSPPFPSFTSRFFIKQPPIALYEACSSPKSSGFFGGGARTAM